MTLRQLDKLFESIDDKIRKDPQSGLEELLGIMKDYSASSKHRARVVMLLSEVNDARMIDENFSGLDHALKLAESVKQELAGEDASSLSLRFEQRQSARRKLRGRAIDSRVVLEAHGIGKHYSGFDLKEVNLQLRLGHITGVVGENANGKTTLLRILAGEQRPSTGGLSYPEFGFPIAEQVNWPEVRRKIAYVPQSLEPWFGSLEDNLRFAAASRGILGTDNDDEFNYIVERLGLREHLNLGWNELSGGYQLRFELARALIWRPQLLILDEPLANLDFKAQLSLLRDIQALARSYTSPIAVAISSQHLHEVEAVADNILFLKRGKVIYNGPTHSIGEKRDKNSFEIGCDATVPQINEALASLKTKRIYFNGLSIVIDTELMVDSHALLTELVKSNIKVTYFRDLSNSVKQLFDQEVVRL